MTEATLFDLVLSTPAAERAVLLDRECAGNPDLRRRVEALLQADAEPGDFLKAQPAHDPTGAYAGSHGESASERPGAVIAGKYKLLQRIGEGGMGSVWMADQTAPVKRRVAVKLIRAERSCSSTILARFEAERQAIALMDHPNIAKLLDAGTTQGRPLAPREEAPHAEREVYGGRPFFVMELVKGVPLTEFCDAHQLTVQERLQLFQQICSAVQHAHQKGIIHRDLKPSNILVESHDGRPVPKVIDFGLAKATSGMQLTEHTLFTGFGTVAGTPLYMAPEQAHFNAVDVDTRADVYALGVLLYELLTGTTPITRETARKAALDEMLRLIREQEAPTPSSRLSSSDSKPSVAANRRVEPTKLGRFVKGELDWIVMKALSKERERRYETASGLAKDIERFLSHEPVLAGPPSAIYKLRKFVQRNKGQVLAAGLVLLALAVGFATTVHQAGRALVAEKEAWENARQEQKRRMEAVRAEGTAQAQYVRAEDALIEARKQAKEAKEQRDRAEKAESETITDYRASTDDAIEQLIGSKPELGPQEKAYLENTLKRWQAFAARQGDDERSRAIRAEGHSRVAFLWQKLNRKQEARTEHQAAREIQLKLVEQYPAVPTYKHALTFSHINLGNLLADLGMLPEALSEYQAARDIQHKLIGQFPDAPKYQQSLAGAHSNQGKVLQALGKHEEAWKEHQAAREIRKQLVERFPAVSVYRKDLGTTLNNLGVLLARLGRRAEARIEYQAARAIRKRLVEQYPLETEYQQDLASIHNNLGVLLDDFGIRDDARIEFLAARDIRKKLVEQFPGVPAYRQELARTHDSLGVLLANLGQREEARTEYLAAREIQQKLAMQFPAVPEHQRNLAQTHNNLGALLANLGTREEALAEYLAARDIQRKLVEQFRDVPVYQKELAFIHRNLAALLVGLARLEEARVEYQAARDLQRTLVEQFPAVPDYLQALALTHHNLGNLCRNLREGHAVRVEWESVCALRRKLVEQFPDVTEYQIELGGSYCDYGRMIRTEGNPAESLEWFDRAIRTLRPVHDKEPRDAKAKRFLRNSHWNRARAYDRLQKPDEAIKDWDGSIELSPPAERPGLRASRAISQVQAGLVAVAVAEVVELTAPGANATGLANWTAGRWYDFACVYAVASGKIRDKQKEYADRAMEMLQIAVKAGYKDAAHVAKDKDLDALRDRQDFKQLLAELEKK